MTPWDKRCKRRNSEWTLHDRLSIILRSTLRGATICYSNVAVQAFISRLVTSCGPSCLNHSRLSLAGWLEWLPLWLALGSTCVIRLIPSTTASI
ncbi:hypothetical protein FA13DRAFT_346639 [Coprinellus micaceus]|uniref:Uncharacterized protein n=1 Tax=Coprinellus micaceus TaxID=71717 RepID=A0A4Y7SCT4_COPMI|nr:hypothetical protein FA13DRAFT_346639 [Coprinellus micaceus]